MKVVVIGGGFCGALVAKLLSKKKDVELVLIDKKDYFEYTPSVHKLMFDDNYESKIRVPFSNFVKGRIVTDSLKQVMPEFVETDKEKIQFDYLVITTGIEYPIFLENKEKVFTVSNGVKSLELNSALKSAESVLVIGGGLIGVEVAGELVEKSKKKVIVVHPYDRFLERNPAGASSYARKVLEKRGAKLIFSERVEEREGNVFITNEDTKIEADVAIWCAGIKCNPWFMQGFPDSIFTDKRALKVNEYLQLTGYQTIFVGGDINSVKEEKTAHNAERHAKVIVKNILLMSKSKPLKSYSSHSSPLVISLGDKRAILTFSKFSWGGFLPAVLKKLIEWFVLLKYR